ncbi:hypothetical protein L195_g033552, partial [Trifolium pratense]
CGEVVVVMDVVVVEEVTRSVFVVEGRQHS